MRNSTPTWRQSVILLHLDRIFRPRSRSTFASHSSDLNLACFASCNLRNRHMFPSPPSRAARWVLSRNTCLANSKHRPSHNLLYPSGFSNRGCTTSTIRSLFCSSLMPVYPTMWFLPPLSASYTTRRVGHSSAYHLRI